jgi:hypothetical protein
MRDVAVVTRIRAPDALRWATVGALAVVALVCSFLPVARLYVSGGRAAHLQRDVAVVPDLLPRSLLIVLPALALLGTAAAGLVYGSRRWVAVIAFAAGLTLAVTCWSVEAHFTYGDPTGMTSCDAPCAGFVLLPATRDLRDDLLSTPAGRRPGFELTGGEDGYNAQPLGGDWHGAWLVLLASGTALAILGSYALVRLALSPWRAALLVGVIAFLFFVFWVLWASSQLD